MEHRCHCCAPGPSHRGSTTYTARAPSRPEPDDDDPEVMEGPLLMASLMIVMPHPVITLAAHMSYKQGRAEEDIETLDEINTLYPRDMAMFR